MNDRATNRLHDVIRGITGPDDNPDSGLPSQAAGDYEPYGRPANKQLVSLHFITCDGNVRSFQYRHLDSDSRFEHHRITIRFMGYRPWLIIIDGQRLWELYDYIHQDRMPWVMQATRDFPVEGVPFVSKLTFIDLIDGEV